MSRPPKSDALHRLQGTRAHATTVDLDDDSKEFTSGRMKMPPEWKGTQREAAWRLIFNPIQKRKTLTRVDSTAATILVEMWCRWRTVAVLAATNPIIEVSWRDSAGIDHVKQVESPASKMATSLEHKLLMALAQFGASPVSREKARKTKEPALKPGKIPTERERLVAEMEELKARQAEQQPAAEPDNSDTELLNSINEELIQ